MLNKRVHAWFVLVRLDGFKGTWLEKPQVPGIAISNIITSQVQEGPKLLAPPTQDNFRTEIGTVFLTSTNRGHGC